MAKVEERRIVFDTGTTIGRPDYGIIGIDDRGEVFQGFDGEFPLYVYRGDARVPLTAAELRELAALMLVRWQQFHDQADAIAARIAEEIAEEDGNA